jgi:hypothetical protein
MLKVPFHTNFIGENYPKIHFQLVFHSHLSLKIPFCNNFHKCCVYNEKDKTKKACGFLQKHCQLVGPALISIQVYIYNFNLI